MSWMSCSIGDKLGKLDELKDELGKKDELVELDELDELLS